MKSEKLERPFFPPTPSGRSFLHSPRPRAWPCAQEGAPLLQGGHGRARAVPTGPSDRPSPSSRRLQTPGTRPQALAVPGPTPTWAFARSRLCPNRPLSPSSCRRLKGGDKNVLKLVGCDPVPCRAAGSIPVLVTCPGFGSVPGGGVQEATDGGCFAFTSMFVSLSPSSFPLSLEIDLKKS